MTNLKAFARIGVIALTVLALATTVANAAMKGENDPDAHCEHQAQNDLNDRNSRCEGNFASDVTQTTTLIECLGLAEQIYEGDLEICEDEDAAASVRNRGFGGPRATTVLGESASGPIRGGTVGTSTGMGTDKDTAGAGTSKRLGSQTGLRDGAFSAF